MLKCSTPLFWNSFIKNSYVICHVRLMICNGPGNAKQLLIAFAIPPWLLHVFWVLLIWVLKSPCPQSHTKKKTQRNRNLIERLCKCNCVNFHFQFPKQRYLISFTSGKYCNCQSVKYFLPVLDIWGHSLVGSSLTLMLVDS